MLKEENNFTGDLSRTETEVYPQNKLLRGLFVRIGLLPNDEHRPLVNKNRKNNTDDIWRDEIF